MKIEINSFEDICKYQAILDREIGKVRDNGFIPKERDLNKIALSAIAECIEFNEETYETHKTWKQKEFNDKNVLEEITDISFFIAQLYNAYDEEQLCFLDSPCVADTNAVLLDLIHLLSEANSGKLDFYEITQTYGTLINSVGLSEEDIFQEYARKFEVNMTRINKDWSL